MATNGSITASASVSVVSTDPVDGGGSGSGVLVMELAAKEGTATEKYFRVHSFTSQYELKPSIGSVTRAGTGTKKCIEYVTFNGTRDAGLRYPNPDSSTVKLSVVGNLFTASDATASVKYDQVRRSVVATAACYGVVKVTYDSPYDLWKATFGRTTGF